MDVTKIINLINTGITFLQMIGGAVGFLFFCWGAIQITTSGWRYQQADRGKETMVYAMLGLGLLLIGGTIVRLILTAMGANIPLPTGVGG
jgi:hypothetical protein